MKFKKLSFMILSVFLAGVLNLDALSDVVYDNTPTVTSTWMAEELSEGSAQIEVHELKQLQKACE